MFGNSTTWIPFTGCQLSSSAICYTPFIYDSYLIRLLDASNKLLEKVSKESLLFNLHHHITHVNSDDILSNVVARSSFNLIVNYLQFICAVYFWISMVVNAFKHGGGASRYMNPESKVLQDILINYLEWWKAINNFVHTAKIMRVLFTSFSLLQWYSACIGTLFCEGEAKSIFRFSRAHSFLPFPPSSVSLFSLSSLYISIYYIPSSIYTLLSTLFLLLSNFCISNHRKMMLINKCKSVKCPTSPLQSESCSSHIHMNIEPHLNKACPSLALFVSQADNKSDCLKFTFKDLFLLLQFNSLGSSSSPSTLLILHSSLFCVLLTF